MSAALPGSAHVGAPMLERLRLRRAGVELEMAARNASRYGGDPSIRAQHQDTVAGLASASAAAANADEAR